MTKHNLGLVGLAREQLIRKFRDRRGTSDQLANVEIPKARDALRNIPERFCRFDKNPEYEKILLHQSGARKLGVENPFFKSHDGLAGATSQIGGKTYINFSSYNYLGLSGDSRVNQACRDALERYGTSPSASRLVAGERPVQRELEMALADVYGVEDCVAFVSGHATNVTTISTLFGPKDLVVHDSLSHNSIFEGIKLSGATRRAFKHNDPASLEAILAEIRGNFERVLIVIEGLYSMDGDIPDLPRFIEIKNRYKAFLMVDEAHALGVLGSGGKGLHEHFGVSGKSVDIWMGTLSKSLSSCGGYIAGDKVLVEILKYSAPGFVYSVGLPPVMAAAALAALQILQREPERVLQLRQMGKYFLETARAAGVDTGYSEGYCVIPAISGSSLKSVQRSSALFAKGVNVQPIIYPAVEERAARLRFFISCQHTKQQIDTAISLLSE